ncbi:hypothetical protein NW759_17752 [Fusarium solani]|nr:hypothetical protein NW759_17752 [Fusarium solani]
MECVNVGSIRWRGSRSGCGAPLRCRRQCWWKCSSERTWPCSCKDFRVWRQGSPWDLVKDPVQVNGGGGSFLLSNFRCSSTFLRASCDTQPCTAAYSGPESSIGTRICCRAWFDLNSDN